MSLHTEGPWRSTPVEPNDDPAAPDLLAALVELVDALDAIPDHLMPADRRASDAYVAGRDVIAKAAGAVPVGITGPGTQGNE